MEGKERIGFSNEGLFSSITTFTTRIGMIDAVETYGLGGDSLRCRGKDINGENSVDWYKGFAPSSSPIPEDNL